MFWSSLVQFYLSFAFVALFFPLCFAPWVRLDCHFICAILPSIFGICGDEADLTCLEIKEYQREKKVTNLIVFILYFGI